MVRIEYENIPILKCSGFTLIRITNNIFLARHIALVAPEVLVVMGNISCDALLGRRGITRLRGKWAEAQGLPALPMFHPAYLLRQPQMKREAWADLLELKAKLRAGA